MEAGWGPDVVELAASDLPMVVLDHVFSGCVGHVE